MTTKKPDHKTPWGTRYKPRPRRKKRLKVTDKYETVRGRSGVLMGKAATRSGNTILFPLVIGIRRNAARAGAEAIHKLGKANKFSSETARKAVQKRWDNTRTVRATGKKWVRLTKKRSIDHAAHREYYAEHPEVDGGYDRATGTWYRVLPDGSRRVITERQALTRLGHLKNYKRYIPILRRRKVDGTTSAQ